MFRVHASTCMHAVSCACQHASSPAKPRTSRVFGDRVQQVCTATRMTLAVNAASVHPRTSASVISDSSLMADQYTYTIYYHVWDAHAVRSGRRVVACRGNCTGLSDRRIHRAAAAPTDRRIRPATLFLYRHSTAQHDTDAPRPAPRVQSTNTRPVHRCSRCIPPRRVFWGSVATGADTSRCSTARLPYSRSSRN